MEQLRLAGVHDDGEHLVVEDGTGTRRLLRIDQELRLAVQRARRLPGARQRGTGQFGPREIQARFRAGATVEEIVAESGWEAARVRRYEWPILAERAHVAAEAQKVEIEDRSARRGYHSVFEGEPLTLGRAVAHRAADLGVDPSSLEWDSWQREDHLWSVTARFAVVDPDAAPAHDEPRAEWLYNPANQSVRPANAWAEAITEPGPPDTPLGTGLGVLDGGLGPELTQLRRSAVEADDLLDVLQSRRGQRIGEDVAGDDALAELLGRGTGHGEPRPRPLAAPEDTPVFDRPFQPATRFPEPDAAPRPAGPQPAQDDDAVNRAAAAHDAADSGPASTDSAPAVPERTESHGTAPDGATSEGTAAEEPAATERPRPRNKTAKARRSARSSVPSWDEIVFGNSSD